MTRFPKALHALLATALAGLTTAGCVSTPTNKGLPELVVTRDPIVVERGRYLAHGPAHCASCHSEQPPAPGQDRNLSGGRQFDLGLLGDFTARNLTSDSETGIGAWSDEDIFQVLRSGRTREGRPLAPLMATTGMSNADLVAVVSYLRQLAPVRKPQRSSQVSAIGHVALSVLLEEPAKSPGDETHGGDRPHQELGAYLADKVANCKGCHTPRSPLTGRHRDTPYAGGLELKEPAGTFVVPNITRGGVLATTDESQFVSLFRERSMKPGSSPMPWVEYARMSDQELRAIYRYLHKLPAATGPNKAS